MAKYAVEAQSEKGSILPWSEAGAVIYSIEVLEAIGNYCNTSEFYDRKRKRILNTKSPFTDGRHQIIL